MQSLWSLWHTYLGLYSAIGLLIRIFSVFFWVVYFWETYLTHRQRTLYKCSTSAPSFHSAEIPKPPSDPLKRPRRRSPDLPIGEQDFVPIAKRDPLAGVDMAAALGAPTLKDEPAPSRFGPTEAFDVEPPIPFESLKTARRDRASRSKVDERIEIPGSDVVSLEVGGFRRGRCFVCGMTLRP